jgi:hypothetical protein
VTSKWSLVSGAVALVVLVSGAWQPVALSAQTDLDALMKKVVARRDDNWKKLQQYILTEKEVMEFRGPGQLPLWGERRDYQWYLRDGFFVRSPLKVNGVTVGDEDRRKYEDEFTQRERARDKRIAERQRQRAEQDAKDGVAPISTPPAAAPENVDTLIAQTREPQFISSAYFLKFKFEEGKYALVGRETLDGKDVLKVEYYPAQLFNDDIERNKRRTARGEKLSRDQQSDQTIEGAMNKVSLVTLWVEPKASQIVKYTFDNVNLDFLPGARFVRLSDLKATMVMSQPFASAPDVWLPKNINFYASMVLALGQFDVRYLIEYVDYKLAETSSRIK